MRFAVAVQSPQFKLQVLTGLAKKPARKLYGGIVAAVHNVDRPLIQRVTS